MLPEMLHRTRHQQVASVIQWDADLALIFLEGMADLERSGFPKTDGTYDGVGSELFLFIAMPGNTVLPAPVKIEQNAGELNSRHILHPLFDG